MTNTSKQLNFSNNQSHDDWSPIFGDEVLHRLAGSVMKDPYIAIVELVANCWDAGATKVDITLPSAEGKIFSIEDNGHSMTKQEFQSRWRDMTYDRTKEQPNKVSQIGNQKKIRKVFGCNGIGRHAMFCFCDEYFIEINKDGKRVSASVKRILGKSPFIIDIIEESETKTQGTKIWCTAIKNISLCSELEIANFIGSRFVVDPEFKTYVNEHLVSFEDLSVNSEYLECKLDNGEIIAIRRFDSGKAGKTSKQNGVAYWVNNKLVGMPNWDGFDGSLLIDARHKEAKSCTYVVDASPIGKTNVKADWSGFHACSLVNEVKKKVSFAVREDLKNVTRDLRERNKQIAIGTHKAAISRLPVVTQIHISEFIEEIQLSCNSILLKDLENMVGVLTKLENAKTGYSLLEKISKLETIDLDDLNSILSEWSVNDAKKVLYEIEWRLKLIVQMESLLHIKTADELHHLQPLFDRGLWILGHEYDSIDFTSNRELSTVLRILFDETEISRSPKRPDFVVISRESALSVFAREDVINPEENKIKRFQTVVIVELKRPGVAISYEQIDQARYYAREIRKHVSSATRINCYVLGSTVDNSVSLENKEGNIYIYPTEYINVLAQAKRRLFKLRDEISSFEEVEDYLNSAKSSVYQADFF